MISLPLAYIGHIWFNMPEARRGELQSEARRGHLFRRLVAALRQRRWQQAPPISHLSDHIRRDIGLPPAGERLDWQRHR